MRDKFPFFSIIVPTYERPHQLTACLKGLNALRYPKDRVEIIIVDDGSRVSPEPLVTPLLLQFSVTLVHQTHAGPSAARNTGAGRATGEFLVFIDDDCAPAPEWLERLAEHFAAHPKTAIGGRTINACTANSYSTASQLLLDCLYDYYKFHDNHDQFFASNNLAFPAHMFRGIGGFDESFTRPGAEDRELCFRWLFSGHSMIYASDAVIYHSHRLSLLSFLKQHVRYGRGALQYHRLRQQRLHVKLRLRYPHFYTKLILYPLSVGTPAKRIPLLVTLLFVSQCANASGFFWELGNHFLRRVVGSRKPAA